MKQLLIYSLVSFILLVAGVTLYTNQNNKQVSTHQTAQKANTEALETYSYVITSIDKEGITGDSLTDDTGIYLTHESVKGLSIKEGSKVKVSFPPDDYEHITKVELLQP